MYAVKINNLTWEIESYEYQSYRIEYVDLPDGSIPTIDKETWKIVDFKNTKKSLDRIEYLKNKEILKKEEECELFYLTS